MRERVERLFDAATFHETGALAGRATYGDDGSFVDSLPANTVVDRAASRAAGRSCRATTSRSAAAPPTRRSGVSRLRRAARGRHRRRGLGEDARADGFSYVPPLPGFDLVVENLFVVPVVAAALGPDGGWAPRAWSARTSE